MSRAAPALTPGAYGAATPALLVQRLRRYKTPVLYLLFLFGLLAEPCASSNGVPGSGLTPAARLPTDPVYRHCSDLHMNKYGLTDHWMVGRKVTLITFPSWECQEMTPAIDAALLADQELAAQVRVLSVVPFNEGCYAAGQDKTTDVTGVWARIPVLVDSSKSDSNLWTRFHATRCTAAIFDPTGNLQRYFPGPWWTSFAPAVSSKWILESLDRVLTELEGGPADGTPQRHTYDSYPGFDAVKGLELGPPYAAAGGDASAVSAECQQVCDRRPGCLGFEVAPAAPQTTGLASTVCFFKASDLGWLSSGKVARPGGTLYVRQAPGQAAPGGPLGQFLNGLMGKYQEEPDEKPVLV